MSEVVNTVSAFVIKELSGDEREVRLVGRALPYRPFELSTSQRLDVTWYPGFAEATSTVLGAQEDPTTIDGKWKDKFISSEIEGVAVGGVPAPNVTFPITENGQGVQNVRQAVQLFDDICRKGQLLEVTWDEQARRGHLRKFVKRFSNVHDLEWTMEFDWISRAEAVPPAIVTTEESFSDIASAFRLDFDFVLSASIPPPFPLTLDFQVGLDLRLDATAGLVSATADLTASLSVGAISPVDSARRMAAVCDGMIANLNDTLDFIRSNPPISVRFRGRAVAGGGSPALLTATFTDQIVAARYFNDMERANLRMRRTATFRRAALSRQAGEDIRAIYTAREGEDLRQVARRYYGDADQWTSILKFNGLRSPALRAGMVLLIPNPAAAGLPAGC